MRLAHDRWELTESTIGAWATQFQVPEAGGDRATARSGCGTSAGRPTSASSTSSTWATPRSPCSCSTATARTPSPASGTGTARCVSGASAHAARRGPHRRQPGAPLRRPARRASRAPAASPATSRRAPRTTSAAASCATRSSHAIDWSTIPWRSSPEVFRRLKRAILDAQGRGPGAHVREGAARLAARADRARSSRRSWTPSSACSPGPARCWRSSSATTCCCARSSSTPTRRPSSRACATTRWSAAASPRSASCAASCSFPPDFERLDAADERIVLHAMHRQLVERAICLRDARPAREAADDARLPELLPPRAPRPARRSRRRS